MKSKSHSVGTTIAIAILTIILVIGLALLGAWIALFLWEAVMVAAFGLPMLTYGQMCGLIVLIRLLIPFSTNATTNTKE